MNQIYRAIAILAIATALALFFYGLRINSYAIAILGIAPALALAVQLYLGQANAYCNRGLAQDRRGNYHRAIEEYNQAIRLNPNFALAYSNRAATRLALNDNQGALEDCNQAIRLNPNHNL